MKPSQPLTINGKEYNEYATYLNTSPIIKGETYSTAATFLLIPLRKDEVTGQYELLENIPENRQYFKQVLASDLRRVQDMDVLIAFGKTEAALQELVNKKGW